jgi:hypothetical protein
MQSEGIAWPYAIRVADVNGDGRSDFGVALGQGSEERPALYVDDGAGVFRLSDLRETGAIFSFVDADRDRHPDILSSYAGGAEGVERHELQLQLALPPRPTRLVAASTQRGSIRLTWLVVPAQTGMRSGVHQRVHPASGSASPQAHASRTVVRNHESSTGTG